MIGQFALGGDAGLAAILVARHEGQPDEGSQRRGSCDDVDRVHVFLFLLVYWRVIRTTQKFRSQFGLAGDQPGS